MARPAFRVSRPVWRLAVVALVFLFLGVAASAAAFALIPNPGSAPGIYDDFKWSSTDNGYWHVNEYGATATIKDSILELKGNSIELDRRLQTDPNETVVVARVRAFHLRKFQIGIGVYHAGTVAMELDDDGAKCGRGTDHGWKVDFVKAWSTPPEGKWFYMSIAVINPYPKPEVLAKLEAQNVDAAKLKPVTIHCSLYDARGNLIAMATPTDPRPNTHYQALDEVFLRTWDDHNNDQVDWFYAGPPSGNPGRAIFKPAGASGA